MSKKENWEILNSLKIATIVCIASRPGSDFIQSLLDLHDQIISIDGDLDFDNFYKHAVSVWGTNIKLEKKERLKEINVENFLLEFAYKHLDKFDSECDNLDLKKTSKVDIKDFINHGVNLLSDVDFSRKNAFLAIYGAYSLSRNIKLKNKTILLHHAHHVEKITFLINDFKNIKIIAANREPRSSYCAMLLAIKKHSINILDFPAHTFIINRLYNGISFLGPYKYQDIKINLLEELHSSPKLTMISLSNWLNIEFNDSLLQSTWNGTNWLGDSMSQNIVSVFNKDFKNDSEIKWKSNLDLLDKIVISSLMRDEIKFYNYNLSYTNNFYFLLSIFIILIPNSIERNLFKKDILEFNITLILKDLFYLFKRYQIMYKKIIFSALGIKKIYKTIPKL
tara:strand:+ start:46689 stop:47870 length:1182 start_codon:yes stop_codon:yes gene_type:complete